MSIRFDPDRRGQRSALRITAVLAGVLALSGCSAEAHVEASAPGVTGTTTAASSSTASSSTASSSTAPSSTAASTAAQSSTAPTAPSGSYRSSRCLASNLTGALGSGDGAAGSTITPIVLRNTGEDPCTLQGWPGVSFIDGSGHQVGAAAVLDRGSVHQTVTLVPGGRAQALLKIGQALNFPKSSCEPVTVRRLRVYPPGSTASIVIDSTPISACSKSAAGQLTVDAFAPAS